jgi:uncharacterized protein with ParB-like and HNH nuclease domain
MKITPTTLTLSQLFSSANEQFVIPAYQRRYSWQEKQLAELFDDINYLRSDDTHLLGSVVCLTYSHTAGVNPLEVVDGQQRITTLSIFLKVLQDRYEELGKDEIAREIANYLVCKGIDRKPQNKILLGDLDNADYALVLGQKNFAEVKNPNLAAAYKKLREWVNALTVDVLNELYFKFINNVLVIRLDVGDAKDAYRLFETINNRGLKLDSTDIIKNFLLGHASTIDKETLSAVRENWKNLIIYLDRIDTDKFFRQYMSGIRTYKVTDTYVIDEFKKFYFNRVKEAENLAEYELYSELPIENPEDIEDELGYEETEINEQEESKPISTDGKVTIKEFSATLRSSSKIYSNILNREFSDKKVNQHLFNLQRIRSFPSYIFLLNVFQRKELDARTQAGVLKLLEIFMLRRHVCEYRTGELDSIFGKLIPIGSDNIEDDVKEHLAKDLPSDSEFQEKFSMADFRREINRAKYILEQLEYHLIEDKGEYIIQSGSDVHLEHIIPQTIDTKKAKKEYGDWETYLLNIIASNNPFESKLKEYQKSNLKLTKNLCTEYSDKPFDFNAVDERSERLAGVAVRMWSF